MNCLDFINSIGHEDFSIYIKQYFDQIMALYKICKGMTIVEVSSILTNSSSIQFDLVFADPNDISTMEYLLARSNNIVMLYNTIFSVTSNRLESQDSLSITIRPCA